MDFQPFHHAPRFGRDKRFIQRRRLVGVEVVSRWAKSNAIRRAVTFTRRVPANGSNTMNRFAVPFRSYSSSTRSGYPGVAGMGRRVSATRCLLVSSTHTWGRWGS
jgi:hypothetical protein